jgi:hypothetical protein
MTAPDPARSGGTTSRSAPTSRSCGTTAPAAPTNPRSPSTGSNAAYPGPRPSPSTFDTTPRPTRPPSSPRSASPTRTRTCDHSRYCARASPTTTTTALSTTVTGTTCTGSSGRSTRPRDHASKHFRSPATPRRRRVRVRQRPLLHDRRTRLVLRRGHRAGLGSLPDRPRLTAGRLTRCSAWVSLACGQQARGGPQRTFLLTWRRVSSIGSARFGRVHA